MTRKPPFCHHLVSYDRRLSGIIVAVAVMLLPTVSVVAQDASEEQNKHGVRVGVYFSLAGIASNIDFTYNSDIFSGEDDSMPYPGTDISIGYNRYQGIIAWNNNDDNESISKFIMRYNYYPFKKDIYVFGGIVIWRFNKKFSYRRYIETNEFTISMDPNRTYEIKADRPDGKSITPGINVGFGIEYKPRNLIWSHEIEVNFSNCKYKEFICGRWPDLKLLGLHLEF